jgi:hypothetical protein
MNYNVCPKCGGQVLNNQNFCNYCGTPINNLNNQNMNNQVMNNMPTTGKLFISRVNNFYGCAVKLTIYINGCAYSLENGGRIDLDLVPGVYNITWRFWCRRDKNVQINVMPGNWYQLEFKPDYLWGGFKLSDRCKFM